MPTAQTLERSIARVELFHFNSHDGGSTTMEELAYQRREGERIAQQSFFYDPAQMLPRKP